MVLGCWGAGGDARGRFTRIRAALANRAIRGHARRMADGDIDGLTDVLRPSRDLDAATQQAVDGLRGFGYSWAEIAARLGATRQAARQRWGRPSDR